MTEPEWTPADGGRTAALPEVDRALFWPFLESIGYSPAQVVAVRFDANWLEVEVVWQRDAERTIVIRRHPVGPRR